MSELLIKAYNVAMMIGICEDPRTENKEAADKVKEKFEAELDIAVSQYFNKHIDTLKFVL